MPNQNGRIYTTANNGISIEDIQTVLNTERDDLGGIISNATNINKWSKMKPVRHFLISTPAMASVNYGIDIPQNGYSSLPSLVAAVDGGYSWNYLKPRGRGQGSGSSDEWFRILDFDGYDQNAAAPLSVLQSTYPVTVNAPESTASVTVTFTKVAEGDTYGVTLGILKPYGGNTFSSMYFGICLYDSINGTYYARTQSSTFSAVGSSTEVSVNIPDIPATTGGTRTYRAIPFFSTQALTSTIIGSTSLLGSLFPIPLAECTVTITKTEASTTTYVLAYTNQNEISPLYYRLCVNTNVSLLGVQYQIIACKSASGTYSPDDVVLVSGVFPTSDTGNIYLPSETTWNAVNNTGFYPVVTEENGYTNIRCEMRRGEVAFGTHSALAISWDTGSSPFDNN